jgi:hypothetical protein
MGVHGEERRMENRREKKGREGVLDIGYWVLGIGDRGVERVKEGDFAWSSGHGGLLLVIWARPFGRFGLRCFVLCKTYSFIIAQMFDTCARERLKLW